MVGPNVGKVHPKVVDAFEDGEELQGFDCLPHMLRACLSIRDPWQPLKQLPPAAP